MCDGDEGFGTLAEVFAVQGGDAEFGDDIMDVRARCDDSRAGFQLRDDPGNGIIFYR